MRADRAPAGRRATHHRVRWMVMGGIGALLAFSTALRFGGPRTKDAIRVFNKRVLNPAMLTVAGRHHWYAAALHHTGRTTGRDYATPVVAVPVEGGYVIPLPYGEDVDWLKNVLAKGGATLVFDGATHELVSPRSSTPPPRYRCWTRSTAGCGSGTASSTSSASRPRPPEAHPCLGGPGRRPRSGHHGRGRGNTGVRPGSDRGQTGVRGRGRSGPGGRPGAARVPASGTAAPPRRSAGR